MHFVSFALFVHFFSCSYIFGLENYGFSCVFNFYVAVLLDLSFRTVCVFALGETYLSEQFVFALSYKMSCSREISSPSLTSIMGLSINNTSRFFINLFMHFIALTHKHSTINGIFLNTSFCKNAYCSVPMWSLRKVLGLQLGTYNPVLPLKPHSTPCYSLLWFRTQSSITCTVLSKAKYRYFQLEYEGHLLHPVSSRILKSICGFPS